MVINKFNVIGVVIPPAKTDAPLFVDSDAVLSLPISFQGFQAVSRRHTKIEQTRGVVKHLQFSQRHPGGFHRKVRGAEPGKNFFRPPVMKGFYHIQKIIRKTYKINEARHAVA